MKKIIRFIERIVFHGTKILISPLEFFVPRVYMTAYCMLLRRLGLKMTGKPRYISTRAKFDDFELVTLGDRTVVSMYVNFLTHDYSITTALIANGLQPPTDIAVRQPITVGNNVFIGMNVMILPGTTIGDNVIIGGGSVVRGNIPSDSIFVGNPATQVGRLTENPERWQRRLKGEGVSFDKF
ncbi:acyltransferase [Novosphingobium fuchskuhlense]|nr:acyltransferase [Novosphingobium fuchskuhlense]